MGTITTEPMPGIEVRQIPPISILTSPGGSNYVNTSGGDNMIVFNDVEMADAPHETKGLHENNKLAQIRKTVLETRSTDAVIEELSVSTKKLKVKGSDSSTSSSLSTNSRSSARKQPQKQTNGVIGAIAEEIDEDDNGGYSGDEGEAVPEPTEDQERSRERAILMSYLRNREKEAIAKEKVVDSATDNQQSVRWLANNTAARQIIATPREYQVELFEKAKEENIIAVLDTGSGKTLIAVLLLQHIINEELERRAAGLEKKISFFLVDSVALVFQQAAVLRCNLNQNVAQLCGEMGTDRWSAEPWIEYIENNMVIVLTAEVLYQCLHHSYIKMSQISLLIFDEAHHAKRNHPYARIIKDFYISDNQDTPDLPRIFGMTASPVDARVDVEKAAMELENLLSCRILTSTDESMTAWQKSKVKKEMIARYDPLGPPFQTPLFNELLEKFAPIKDKDCRKPLIFARKASAELGAWVADEALKVSFTAEEVAKMKNKMENKFHKKSLMDPQPIEYLNQMLARLDEVAEIIAQHPFEAPQYNASHLSSKVMRLCDYLRERYENPTDDKAIVFVNQRLTARLLTNLLSNAGNGTPHLRAGSLVGTRTAHGGGEEVSFRSQMLTLRRFRSGELNCLFATSVAEEGLDIPDCNLIIRFDLYQTVIQYIQSRGRARLANSKYIHMMEEGNSEHAAVIRSVRSDSGTLQAFYTKLPEDRKLLGNTHNLDYVLAQERAQTRVHREESGAILTYRMALNTLGNFTATLTHKIDSVPTPEYVMGRQGNKFLCEVILPEAAPISGAVGRPADTKQVAKCSAAFEACLALRRGGWLNNHLVSTFKNRGPLMRNARLALGSKAKTEYPMRIKPALWKVGSIQELYLAIIYLKDPGEVGRPTQPIGILTRGPLPWMPRFHLFFSKTNRSPLATVSLSGTLKFDEATLKKLDEFTLKIFHHVFSKEYGSNLEAMSYFIVPILEHFRPDGPLSEELSNLIAWDIINTTVSDDSADWDASKPDSFVEDRFVWDWGDGSRKFFTKKVAHEYQPSSPTPPNTARRDKRWYNIIKNEQDDKNAAPTILQYSNSAWKKTRAQGKKFSDEQPVIEADLVTARRDFLDDRGFPDEPEVSLCYICPEPLKISPIPTKFAAMVLYFPSIIHRIESYLIALEATSMLNLDLAPDLALECLTKDSSNTEEHGQEQVNFQRGMGNNYERLEFYGDCFLKMATSISIYTLHPDGKELDFHVKRMLMICNQNLMHNAKKLKLHEYIRSKGFDRRAWYPEGLVLLKGRQNAVKHTHDLGDKTIADIPEALIGAALLTPGKDHPMNTAVRAVTEFVCSDDHNVQKWDDYYEKYQKPKYQLAPATAAQVDLAQQVEKVTGYHFKYPRLLRSAFTHSTYPFIWGHVPNYQRLEFLGDSILDMVCVRYLFDLFPNKDPQWLTEHKMAMVSNQFLGALCVDLGFHKHLQHQQPIITNSIVDYVLEFEEAKENGKKEALAQGKTEADLPHDFWLHTKHPPKYLADMIESYIGALFVDSGFNYGEVEKFFDKHIKWFFEDVTIYDSFANKHPVTELNRFFEQSMGCVKYRLNATQLEDTGEGLPPCVVATVMIHGKIVCSAQRESARYSKVAVATEAIGLLRGKSPAQFRQEWGCDCKAKGRVEVTTGQGEEEVVKKEVKRQLDVKMRDFAMTDTESGDAGSRRPSVAYG